MAIQSIKERVALKLELDGGMVNGRPKTESKTFNKIKTTATDEALFNTASVLSTLQEKDVKNIKRVEEVILVSKG